MKRIWNYFFKKKEVKQRFYADGFHVQYWKNNKLMFESYSPEDQTFRTEFPYAVRISEKQCMGGYVLQPFVFNI